LDQKLIPYDIIATYLVFRWGDAL